MNNKKRVNFNLSIDLYNFLKQYSEERGITFTTAVDRFLSRSVEQYQMGQTVIPVREETLREENNSSSFNASSNEVEFAHIENEDDQALMEMFNDMPD